MLKIPWLARFFLIYFIYLSVIILLFWEGVGGGGKEKYNLLLTF